MIYEVFEVLENTPNICTHLHSLKECLGVGIRNDEEFYVDVVSTFMARATTIINEEKKKCSTPSNFRIK